MKATIGRIVHYRLSESDVRAITRRRTDGASIHSRIEAGTWPTGAQAHIGNTHHVGQVVPAIIVQVWPNEYGPDHDGINAQAFLDGNDQLWLTSVREGSEPGQWMWPARA